MKRILQSTLGLVGTMFVLGGCNTVNVKIPNFDSLKLPEFREDAENIGDYQDWTSAPQTPNDLRPASEWDKKATQILQMRNRFTTPVDVETSKSNTDIIRALSTQGKRVEEYKVDDPK